MAINKLMPMATIRMVLESAGTGITISPCRLFEESGRRHFMTKRFDWLDGGGKLHMQSLCGMVHYDFNQRSFPVHATSDH